MDSSDSASARWLWLVVLARTPSLYALGQIRPRSFSSPRRRRGSSRSSVPAILPSTGVRRRRGDVSNLEASHGRSGPVQQYRRQPHPGAGHRRHDPRAAAGPRQGPARRRRQPLLLPDIRHEPPGRPGPPALRPWATANGTFRRCACCWRRSCRSTRSMDGYEVEHEFSVDRPPHHAAECPHGLLREERPGAASCWPSRTSPSGGRRARDWQSCSSRRRLLLQEMQHRVANSLQIIASILLLKARTVQSDETRLHLQDAHQRVMSVAAVQQHLQASRPRRADRGRPLSVASCATPWRRR